MDCSRLLCILTCGIVQRQRPPSPTVNRRVDVVPVKAGVNAHTSPLSTPIRQPVFTGVSPTVSPNHPLRPRPPPPKVASAVRGSYAHAEHANGYRHSTARSPAPQPSATPRVQPSPTVRASSVTPTPKNSTAASNAPPKEQNEEFWFGGDEMSRKRLAALSPPGEITKQKNSASVVARAFSPGVGGLKAKLAVPKRQAPKQAEEATEESNAASAPASGTTSPATSDEDRKPAADPPSANPNPRPTPRTPAIGARGRGRGRGRNVSPASGGRYFGGTFVPENAGEQTIHLDEKALRRMAPTAPVEPVEEDETDE